jgi:hypothetical protein
VDRLLAVLRVPADRWRGASRALCSLVVFAALLAAACAPRARLDPAFESDEALARAVLDAVARKDAEALLALSVTKDEFEDLVWPTLRVSRPEVGMPPGYVWQDTFSKSRHHLIQTLAQVGGRRYELDRIEFGGPTTEYGTHAVSRETRLVVRGDDGGERTLRLFGSIIRQAGRSKVFSYIVD